MAFAMVGCGGGDSDKSVSAPDGGNRENTTASVTSEEVGDGETQSM